jgi:hypothetical protein
MRCPTAPLYAVGGGQQRRGDPGSQGGERDDIAVAQRMAYALPALLPPDAGQGLARGGESLQHGAGAVEGEGEQVFLYEAVRDAVALPGSVAQKDNARLSPTPLPPHPTFCTQDVGDVFAAVVAVEGLPRQRDFEETCGRGGE